MQGFGKCLKVGDGIVRTGKGNSLLREELFQDGYRFRQAINAHAGRFKGQTNLLVVGPMPTRSNAQLEAATREEVQCGDFLGQLRGMPEIIVEDETADSDSARHIRRSHKSRDGGKRIDIVIGYQEGGVALILGAAHQCRPRFPGWDTVSVGHAEAEGSSVRHWSTPHTIQITPHAPAESGTRTGRELLIPYEPQAAGWLSTIVQHLIPSKSCAGFLEHR